MPSELLVHSLNESVEQIIGEVELLSFALVVLFVLNLPEAECFVVPIGVEFVKGLLLRLCIDEQSFKIIEIELQLGQRILPSLRLLYRGRCRLDLLLGLVFLGLLFLRLLLLGLFFLRLLGLFLNNDFEIWLDLFRAEKDSAERSAEVKVLKVQINISS